MLTDFLEEIGRISKQIQSQNDEESIRESLQILYLELLSRQKNSKNPIGLQEQYFIFHSVLRSFYTVHYQHLEQDILREPIQLTALCKAIAFCSDLLCVEKGKRIFYLGQNEPLWIFENEKRCIWAIFTFLAEALENSKGKYIGIETKAFGNSVLISIVYNCKRGFIPIRNTAADMHYQSFCLHTKNSPSKNATERAILCFSQSVHNNNKQSMKKDFTAYTENLLGDSFSPLYIALCDFL